MHFKRAEAGNKIKNRPIPNKISIFHDCKLTPQFELLLGEYCIYSHILIPSELLKESNCIQCSSMNCSCGENAMKRCNFISY